MNSRIGPPSAFVQPLHDDDDDAVPLAEHPRRDSRGRALERIPSPAPLWQKGQSGNPSGKSGFYHEAMKLARELTPAAVRRLGELAGLYPDEVTGEWIPLSKLDIDPRVVSVACLGLTERTLGKPKEYDPNSDSESTVKLDYSRLSPEQRQQMRDLLDIAGQETAVVEARRRG
jgi:hypothetical protein